MREEPCFRLPATIADTPSPSFRSRLRLRTGEACDIGCIRRLIVFRCQLQPPLFGLVQGTRPSGQRRSRWCREHRLELHAGKDKIITRRPSLPFLLETDRVKKKKRNEVKRISVHVFGETSVSEVSIATLNQRYFSRKDL